MTDRRANDYQISGNHYQTSIQHWDFVVANGLDYFQAAITKYVVRWRQKGGVEDLRKAQHYLAKYMELIEAGARFSVLTQHGISDIELQRRQHEVGGETICLIGSSRFKKVFEEVGRRLETSGNLVLCMTFFAHADGIQVSSEERVVLRKVDRRRVDLANKVWVVDVGGYIGEDTCLEMEYAASRGKDICYLSKEMPDLAVSSLKVESSSRSEKENGDVPLWHWADQQNPDVALCGASYANMYSTEDMRRVTCPNCRSQIGVSNES